MKRALLIAALLWLWPAETQAAVKEPGSCDRATVLAYIANAGNGVVNGDTIRLPTCGATNWTDTFAPLNSSGVPLGLMLEGQPCATASSGKTDASSRAITVATSCPTNIVDAVVGAAPLFNMAVPPCTHPCGYQVGLRHLNITSSGQRTGHHDAWSYWFPSSGTASEDGRRLKFEYLRIVGITGAPFFFMTSEWGVFSHVYMAPAANTDPYFLQHQGGGSGYSPARTDQRLASSTFFGREDAITVESSVFVNTGTPCTQTRLTDAHGAGVRMVIRNNYIEGWLIDSHGIESSYMRGNHYYEVFGNKFTPCQAGSDALTIGHIRSGPVMAWNNVMTAAFASNTPAVRLVEYRSGGQFQAYEEIDGRAAVDENNPSNPLVVCTTTSVAEFSAYIEVTVDVPNCTGDTSFSTNEYAGFYIYQTSPACRVSSDGSCGITINSNTTTTIRFKRNLYDGVPPPSWPNARTLNLAAGGGDTIHINAVTSTLDGPCRSGGALFGPSGFISGTTISGATATLTSYSTMAALGIANNDYVVINSGWQDTSYPVGCGATGETPCSKPYTGTYQVSNVSGSSFDYTPRRVPSGNATVGFDELKERLSNSSAQTSACYEFLNFNASNNAVHFDGTIVGVDPATRYQSLRLSGTDANPGVMFNWVGTSTTVGRQTSSSSPFSGASGVGVGTIANRPATCTTSVFYWAENESEWDSTNGATADGNGYKCTATNTWTLYYTPLAFPHPLTSDVGGVSSVTPAACVQGETLNNAALAGVGFQGAGAAFAITGADVTLSDTNITSNTAATIDIACGASAAVGTRSVYLTATAGTGYGATFTVNASADTTKPVPGASGAITTASVTSQGLTLNWTKGTDNVTAQGSLLYEVRQSLANNIDTVANAEANGTALNPYSAGGPISEQYSTDINSYVVSGLSPATTYYFNVILKDAAGNKEVYVTKSETTAGDVTAPTPGGAGGTGDLTTSNITSSTVTLGWLEAIDELTPQNLLVYEVRRSTTNNIGSVATAEANGTIVLAYIADIDGVTTGGLSAATTYWFNVIVKDQAGNKAAYTQKSVTTEAAAPAGNVGRGRVRVQ
jgi:hypothetical protein